MKKSDVVQAVLGERLANTPEITRLVEAYAPSNIALCKYWGKRDQELNLPVTSSLSVGLQDRGSRIRLSGCAGAQDRICLNGVLMSSHAGFVQRFTAFVDLFRPARGWRVAADIYSSVPVGAGLASSACGFASLVLALDQWLNWRLERKALSLLARLGSGSACRSLWPGFVEWQAGEASDGMDSMGMPLQETWPALCIGLLILSVTEKPVSSREAMQRTVETSQRYKAWPAQVVTDLETIRAAIREKDFVLLGEAVESNAVAMHATMQDATPSISYALPGTIVARERVKALREAGVKVYFTQDAGPNLKLLFLEQDLPLIQAHFPAMQVVRPFPQELKQVN